MSLDEALQNELRGGLTSLSAPELVEGVARFTSGAGRGGRSA